MSSSKIQRIDMIDLRIYLNIPKNICFSSLIAFVNVVGYVRVHCQLLKIIVKIIKDHIY